MWVIVFVVLVLSCFASAKDLGELSANPYDPNSTSNPYARYDSRFSPDSITNPYRQGLRIEGR